MGVLASLSLAPETTASTVGFIIAGIALGMVSGLVPGLHANNLALLLAGVAPAIPAAAPLQLGRRCSPPGSSTRFSTWSRLSRSVSPTR